MDTHTLIHALEQELLTPEARTSPTRLNELLADDFREIASSGSVYTKDDCLRELPIESPRKFKMSNFSVVELSDDSVLAMYTVEKVSSDGTHLMSARSSIWKKNGKHWQMLFHQGTIIS